MKKHILFRQGVAVLISLIVMLNAASCGTVIYPERRGQRAGRLDVAIVILDGIGLLFFLVPGVIAFAVDFATGAIYLPSGSACMDIDASNLQKMDIVQTQPNALTRQKIERLVSRKTGKEIDLLSSDVRVTRASSGPNHRWTTIEEIMTPNQLVAFEHMYF